MAKKDVSVIVSGAGFLASVWTAIMAAVKERGGTDEQVHRLAREDGKELIGEIADLIVGTCTGSFRVVVDYGKPLTYMIDSGKYDWKNVDISLEGIIVEGEGRVEKDLVLVHLNRNVSFEETLNEIDRRGLKPETLESLLAFGAKFPDQQREFPIIALEAEMSIAPFICGVICLDESASRRNLDMVYCSPGHRFGSRCRFLASRK